MRVPGRLKDSPEDFRVEELSLYEPSGTGSHLYVRFTKKNLPTHAAVKMIAKALGANERDIGVAGLKDKVGITTQTISILIPPKDPSMADRARALQLPDITIDSAIAHGNKLRTGHLAGNRFEIVIRDVSPTHFDVVRNAFARIEREGVPNAYGTQRFGRAGDNADVALHWLAGKSPPPRDARLRRLHWSSVQSAIFNEVLERRVAAGTWRTALLGDRLKKTDTGGVFLCTNVQEDSARAERGEVCPTGPMVGVEMDKAEGEPGQLEAEVAEKRLGIDFDWAKTKPLGEGARRPLVLSVRDLRVDCREEDASCRVYFVLPKGAYATTVLANVFELGESGGSPGLVPTDQAD